MAEYELKRGHWRNIEGEKLAQLMVEVFGAAKSVGPNTWESTFGALASCRVRFLNNSQVEIQTEMRRDVSNDVASDTIRAYNTFLERVTGYNAKQRAKKTQGKAKKAGAARVPDVE